MVQRLEPLGSEFASAFRVDAGGQTYALKIQGATPESLGVVLWRAHIMAELARRGHPVPRLVAAADADPAPVVSLEGRLAVVQLIEWEDAVPYSTVPLHRDLAREVGCYAALVQRDLAALPAPPAPMSHPWDAQHAAATLVEHMDGQLPDEARRVGEQALDLHEQLIRPVEAELPVVLVHQDLNDFNVLARARPVCGTR